MKDFRDGQKVRVINSQGQCLGIGCFEKVKGGLATVWLVWSQIGGVYEEAIRRTRSGYYREVFPYSWLKE